MSQTKRLKTKGASVKGKCGPNSVWDNAKQKCVHVGYAAMNADQKRRYDQATARGFGKSKLHIQKRKK